MTVVRPAAQLDVVDRRLSTCRVGIQVMELHESPLTAPAAVVGHERAGATVSFPHLSLDLRGNVTGAWVGDAPAARTVRGSNLLLLQFPDEHFQCLCYYFSDVAIRDLMPE